MEKISTKNNYNNELIKAYKANLQDPNFKELVTKLKITEQVGKQNNSLLEDCVKELKNCANCPGLYTCNNSLTGHYLYPKVLDNIIETGFIPCKYTIENNRLLNERETASRELANARFKKIDVHDKNRVKVIKWIKEFYDNYDGIKNQKGLYLHGSFGSGKTYLIHALLNELKINKKANFIALYFPEILRTLKDDWDTYNDNITNYSSIPLLLIDDIGAEACSEWGRDEVLGTILQNRMNNHLPTFFTSNLTLEELEVHLSLAKNSLDKVKARRIIERIKQLTEDLEIITTNKRK